MGSQTEWQAQVRKYAEAQDWISAMTIVDRDAAAAPRDMDVRAWRARVLTWSGHLPAAEKEYLEILKVARNDPDDWMGLAGVYSREGKMDEALRALSRAVELDPKRADIHAARGRVLRAEGERIEARMEFQNALSWTLAARRRKLACSPCAENPGTNCASPKTTTSLISQVRITRDG